MMFGKSTLDMSVRVAVCSLAVCSVSIASSSAFAKNVLLEEITVTARKTEENLSDVPIAVSAFSGEQLEAMGVENSGDIALSVPNLTWNTEFGRASPQIYMRGVGTNNFAPINQGPVAVYQDGVFIGPNIVQGFAAFDLERMEALKGPQGTLFGRNSTGGLINFVSKKPTIGAGTTGYARLELGDWGTTNIEGAAGFDISENWAARIAGVSNKSDGEFTNNNPDADSEAGGTSDYSIRAQLLYDNQENLTVLLNLHRSFADPDVTPFKVAGRFGPASCASNVVVGQCQTAFGYADDPDLHTTNHQDDLEETENTGGFLKINYDFGEITLTSVTAFDEASIARLDDVDESPASDEWDHYTSDFEWMSQELILSGDNDLLSWHTGVYYYKEENEGLLVFDFPTDDTVYGPGTGFGVGNYIETETTSYAAFAQGVWSLSNTLRLTTGIRWTNEDKDIPIYMGYTNRTDPNQDTLYRHLSDIDLVGGAAINFTTSDSAEEDNISGRISLDYQFNEDVLLYVSAARGFKGGDINGAAVAFAEAAQIVDAETIDAFELGFKGTFLDGNLKANAAVFYMDYQDQQVTVILPGDTAAGEPAFQNAANSELPGFEFDITWAVSEQLTLIGSFGYVDASFEEYDFEGGSFTDNRVPLVSEVEAYAMAQYDIPLSNGGYITLQADASYQSDQFFTVQNDADVESAALYEDALTLFNTSIKYTSPDDRWNVKLFAKNAGDKQYLTSGFGIDGFISAAKPGPGRYVGLSLTVNFGE